MPVEENKAIVRRFIDEFLNGGNLAVADELLTPDYTSHVGGLPAAPPPGPEGWKRRSEGLRSAFPDLHATIEDLLAVDDKVILRYRMHGTHRGAFWGSAPTGKEVAYTGIMILRLRDGKLAEEWTEADLLGLVRQTRPSPEG